MCAAVSVGLLFTGAWQVTAVIVAARYDLGVTPQPVGELTQWTYLHHWGPQRRASHHAFFASVVALPASFHAARIGVRSRAHARLRGRPRLINDSWIAACCIARDLPLATPNIKDYADFADRKDLELVH
jgi:predicted nucleic acid-binding protein